ncbi:MAG TPA: hypothetical protein VGF67_21535 [Ktedonobacteraceae bacterium]
MDHTWRSERGENALSGNLIAAIGQTPLVRLCLGERAVGSVSASLELLNPCDLSDRVARRTILEASCTGGLRDGMPVIESSSATMAYGVALAGARPGRVVHMSRTRASTR